MQVFMKKFLKVLIARSLLLWGVVSVGVLGVCVTWYVSSRGTRAPQILTRAPVTVEVVGVKEGPIGRRVNTNGVLVSAQSVNLCPEIEGRIEKILFHQGERVKKGDLLIQLDESAAKARLREAEAALAFAKSEYHRAKHLYDRKFGNKAALEKTMAEMQVREAAVLVARVSVDQAQIRAPFDGVVGLQNVSEGATVTRNKELVSVVSLSPLYVDFSVPDSYLKYLSVGETVDVTVEGFDDLLAMESRVIALDSQVNAATHSIAVRAEIQNVTEEMRPGQFARVSAELGKEEKALMIPVVAVEKDGERNFVYVVVDSTAVQTYVTLGLRHQGMVQVTDGLKKGDRVVTAGQIKLVDGASVRVVASDKVA